MSFRGRLTLFLLLIVVLPMVVITVLASRIAGDAASGKADARLFAGIETATALYEERTRDAEKAARQLAVDPALGGALREGDPARASEIALALARRGGLEFLRLNDDGGSTLATLGDAPFAAAGIELTGADGDAAGRLTVSVASERDYLEEVRRLTGREAIVYPAGQSSATLPGGEEVELPAEGGADVEVAGSAQRLLTQSLPGTDAPRLALLGPAEGGGLLGSSPAVAAALTFFFLIAFLLALTVMRALSGQVTSMHAAAARIGEGDFSGEVPVVGRDEMAGLAREFNKMSGRLAAQMEQLRRQQVEIDRSVRRIGEAFASGLDRQGLLQIVAETAVSACGADYGMIALSGREGAEVSAGEASERIEDAVLAAEARATRSGELVEHERDGAYALAAPLRRIGERGDSLGVMTVARRTQGFSKAERDLFLYLIGQGSASIENVALHEVVSAQAVTDDLTGLANNRAFGDFADKEAARARRFGHPLSLLMLDIDDFKKVNDTHGHLQGDEVLRQIARILRSESRGIDEPARYGGEEFVVALPETDSEGAAELAERIRERIEREEVPSVSRDGSLRVTASVGVATMPDAAADLQTLIAAADAALYAAKRAGKNRVELAPERNAGGSPRSPDGSMAKGSAVSGRG